MRPCHTAEHRVEPCCVVDCHAANKFIKHHTLLTYKLLRCWECPVTLSQSQFITCRNSGNKLKTITAVRSVKIQVNVQVSNYT